MKCKKCNTENNKENKFCTSCGAELHNNNIIFCPGCGTENETTNNFCIKCGNNLEPVQKNHSKKSSSKNRSKNPKRIRHNVVNQEKNFNFLNEIKKHKVLVTVVIAFFVFLIFKSIPDTKEYNNYNVPSQNNYVPLTSNVTTDTRVTDIANKFLCSCGDCKDSLEICNCDKAAEERNLIKEKLDNKVNPDRIVVTVANKYGMLKSKYESKYNIDRNKVYYGL